MIIIEPKGIYYIHNNNNVNDIAQWNLLHYIY